MDYREFLESKRIVHQSTGLDVSRDELSPLLFPWQQEITEFGLSKGKAAIFADCGLGKTPMQLEWAKEVHLCKGHRQGVAVLGGGDILATIAELLRARNHIAVWEQEHGREATPDDLMVILYNQKVEDDREKRESKKRIKKKQVKKKEYLTKRDKELIIVMAACTQGLQNIIDEWQEHDQNPFLLRCLRTANTWIYKAMEWMTKDLLGREKMSLLRQAAYNEVGIIEYEGRRRGKA